VRNIAIERALAAGWGLFFASGAVAAARLGYAEIRSRNRDAAGLTMAVRIDRFAPPARYFERLVQFESANSERWLDAALQANPRDATAWIAKGLAAERRNDMEVAQYDLLEATRIDHRYTPAWTLTNFYFRRASSGNYGPGPFWRWARRTAGLTYDDFRPLLTLAHSLDPNPRSVIEKLGGGTRLLCADLDYLVQQKRLSQAQEVARILMQQRRNEKADGPRLIALADRQIRAGRARDAVELWNAASTPLDPEHGPILANQDLMTVPTGVAFDWHLPHGGGFTSAWRPGQLKFSLSGDQPDDCVLLEQMILIARGKLYRLRFEYITDGLTSPTGLVWDLDRATGGALSAASSWRAAESVLRPPASSGETIRLGALHLSYRRKAGTTRTVGQIEIRRLTIDVL